MKNCENEHLGHCLICGLPCNEVELCNDMMIGVSKDNMDKYKYDKNWMVKSLKEKYEIIERKREEAKCVN